MLYDLSHIVVVWGLRFILRSEAWDDTLLQIDDVPTIMLSNQKWAFLNHGAIHCLPRHEKNGSRTDVYCVNDMTSRSARYIALHDKQFTLGTESVTGLHYSIWILSDRGECASMRIKVVDLSRHVTDKFSASFVPSFVPSIAQHRVNKYKNLPCLVCIHSVIS